MAGRPDFGLDRTRLLQGDPTTFPHGSTEMLAQYAAAAADAAMATRHVGLADLSATNPLNPGQLSAQFPADRIYPPISLHSQGYAGYNYGSAYHPYLPYLPGVSDSPIFSQTLTGLSQPSTGCHRIQDVHKETKPRDIGISSSFGPTSITSQLPRSFSQVKVKTTCSPIVNPIARSSQSLMATDLRTERPCHGEETSRRRNESKLRAMLPSSSHLLSLSKSDAGGKSKSKGSGSKHEHNKPYASIGQKVETKRNLCNEGTGQLNWLTGTHVVSSHSSHPTSRLGQSSNVAVTLSCDVKNEVTEEVQCCAKKEVSPVTVHQSVSSDYMPLISVPAAVKKSEKAVHKISTLKLEPSDVPVCSEKVKEKVSDGCDLSLPKGHLQWKPKEILPHFSPQGHALPENVECKSDCFAVDNTVHDTPAISFAKTLPVCKKEQFVAELSDSGCPGTGTKLESPMDPQITSTDTAASSSSVHVTSSDFETAIVHPGTRTITCVTSTSPVDSLYEMYPSSLPAAAGIGQHAGTATIPIGIAVARQRQDNNKDVNGNNSNSLHDSNQERQNRQREEFLREQKEILANHNKPEETPIHPDIKTDLNLLVAGSNTAGSLTSWRESDSTRSLNSHWFPSGGTIAPTFWLGQGPYSINHPAVHISNVDPSHIPVNPPAGGYKLAQEPMTGQLFLIPATNLDVIDPSRIWPSLTGAAQMPVMPHHSSSHNIQQPTTTAQPQPQPLKFTNYPLQIGSSCHQVHVPKTEEMVVLDRPDAQKQSDKKGQVVSTTSTADVASPFLNRVPVPVSCATAQPYPYSFLATPLSYLYDPNMIPVHGLPVTDAMMARSEPSVQSRGTSPMTITSASPPPEPETTDLPDDVPLDTKVKHSTISVQTSPDVEQMNEMREQSCQTSETEKEVHDESDEDHEDQEKQVDDIVTQLDENENSWVGNTEQDGSNTGLAKQTITEIVVEVKESVESPDQVPEATNQVEECNRVDEPECDIPVEETKPDLDEKGLQEVVVETEKVCDKRSTVTCCDNIFDMFGDIHRNRTNALETLCCASQVTNVLDMMCKKEEQEVLIDNSYKNLESNMASSFSHESTSSQAAQDEQLEHVDGLTLLSALAEERAEEEQRLISKQIDSDPRPVRRDSELSVFTTTDVSKNFESTMLLSPSLSSCSSPTFTMKRDGKDISCWSPHSGEAGLFSYKHDTENMDAAELEMRMKLAELQRKYKEKQKQLAKLQPRKEKSDDEKQNKRGPGRPRKRKISKVDNDERMGAPDEVKKKHLKKDENEERISHKTSSEEQHTAHQLGAKRRSTETSFTSDVKLLRTLSDGSTSSSDMPLATLKEKMKHETLMVTSQTEREEAESGLQLLATQAERAGSNIIPINSEKEKSDFMTGQDNGSTNLTHVCSKRKPGRPRKLSQEEPFGTETIVAKKSKTLGLMQIKGKRKDSDIPLLNDDDVKPLILLDEEWNRRRSERIFLSDATSPQTSPSVASANKAVANKGRQKVTQESQIKLPSEKKPCKKTNTSTGPFEKGDKSKISTSMKQQKTKQSAAPASSKKRLKFKYVYSDSDSSSESDSDGDNEPLSALKERSQTPDLQNCTIRTNEMEDGLRVLVLMSNLFYEAELKAIQPPDIYGVVIFGERGTRPHIMTQEEVLKEAVIDVQPSSPKFLPEGTRVCAYWSQQFSCLYPGTVVKGSPNPDIDKNLINVEFDDGDSGNIPIDHIRMLPPNFPLCTFSSSEPSPLLLANKRTKRFSSDVPAPVANKDRKASVSEAVPGPSTSEETKKPTGKRGPGRPKKIDSESTVQPGSFEMSTISEQLKKIALKAGKKMPKGTQKEGKKTEKAVVKKGQEEPKKKEKHTKCADTKTETQGAKRTKTSVIRDSHFAKFAKESKVRSGGNVSLSEESSDSSSESDSSSSDSDSESSDSGSQVTSESGDEEGTRNVGGSAYKDGKQTEKEQKQDGRQSGESKSKIAGNASFLPARQLWRWSGKGTRRPGMKGKARKEYYRAITRGREVIKVGDCAVFMSTGRPHLPYVGHIESFWEGWGGNMVVKVTWFYHPEETKGGKRLLKSKGALYESAHGDENDVQTISHKCDVLSFTEYKRQKISNENDNNDFYYLAGSYDPIVGTVVFEPDVSSA